MKFQSAFCTLIISILIVVNSQKLTKQENEQRIKECGRQKLPKNSNGESIAFTKDDWIVKSHSKVQQVPLFSTTGFFISSRHIITSGHSVLNDVKMWGFNNTKFNEEYIENTSHAKVPDDFVKNLEIMMGAECTGTECRVGAKKAILLDMKANPIEFYKHSAVMLIETDRDVLTVQYPCLENNIGLKVGDLLDYYGFNYPGDEYHNGNLIYHELKVIEIMTDWKYICMEGVRYRGDFGGPLLKIVNGLVYVLGSVSVWEFEIDYNKKYFFDLRRYVSYICEYSGVCPKHQNPPATSSLSSTTRKPGISNSPNSVTSKVLTSSFPPSTTRELGTTTSEERFNVYDEKDDDVAIPDIKYPEDDNDFYLGEKTSGSVKVETFLMITLLVIGVWK